MRTLAGALCGAATWALFAWGLPLVPEAVRAVVGLAVFLFGPGAAATWVLLRSAPALDRWIVAFGFGLGAAPALAQLLGFLGLVGLFPFLASALAGSALVWNLPGLSLSSNLRSSTAALCALLVATALALGAAAYAGRLESGAGGLTVFGDYDSFDSTYYAAISGELSHTIPPQAPFYSGHSLNYSYFPHLLLGLVHRFAGVPLLSLYFVYAWPALLVLAALAGFTLVRSLANERVAVIAMLLLLVGSDLSFLVPLLGDTSRLVWDPVIWSTNFFSPGAETLLFNTWTPTLVIIFTGVYAFARYADTGGRGWAAVACASFAWLVPFKTFGYAAVIGGLVLTALVAPYRSLRQRRTVTVLAGTLLLSTPYLLNVVLGYEDSQAFLTLKLFVIPARLVQRLRIPDFLAPVTGPLGLSETILNAVHLAAALGVLFAGGLGFRLLGLPALWRCIREPATASPGWILIAWTTVSGALIPFVIATEPYHGTLHFYQTTIFLMPLFVGQTIGTMLWRDKTTRWVVLALVFACATPSTIHYLHRKRTDRERPLARLDSGGLQIARYLTRLDGSAVILHRAPAEPSLITVLSKQRSVLAWSRYVRNSGDRQREIERFFDSASGDPTRDWEILRKHGVTHVIEARGADRIHPQVLDRLALIIQTPSLTLYAVPATVAAPDGGGRK